MTEQVKSVIRNTVLEMLTQSTSDENIRNIINKHNEKVHFIPIRYRIWGGILQGLNIKFGNFIEQLIGNLVDMDTGIYAMPDSGKKIRLFFTHETDAIIDTYITNRQLPDRPDDCTSLFDRLLHQIIEIEKSADENNRQGIVKDIDGLFKTKAGLMVYTELKYNDDHDTGKFADINRKFIKTWAGLAVKLNIKSPDELMPIIYYFNATKKVRSYSYPVKKYYAGASTFRCLLTNEICGC